MNILTTVYRSIPVCLFVLFSSPIVFAATTPLQSANVPLYSKRNSKESNYQIRSPAQLMAIIETSKIEYTMDDLEKLKADPTYIPTNVSKKVKRMPWIEDRGGSKVLMDFKLNEASVNVMLEGEAFFRKQDFQSALKKYEEAVKIQPNNYLALSHIGDSYVSMNQHAQAIPYFDQAIAANPYAFETYIRKGVALSLLKRWPEAKESYVSALALYPRNPFVLDELRVHSEVMKIKVAGDLFKPKSIARMKGGQPYTYTDTKSPDAQAWLVYGLCRAIWLAEPPIPKEAPKGGDIEWEATEDVECLGSALTLYEGLKKNEKLQPVLEFERVKKILEKGYFYEFLLYQFASQVNPMVTLGVSSEQMKRLKEFIRIFVLMPKK
ncbi:MAG: tetratricopeptide repeat protein [Proteobacteria bacterium]|nr:MAG: tetratricopeptide repeat protein [Pseudomonadota bacterium]